MSFIQVILWRFWKCFLCAEGTIKVHKSANHKQYTALTITFFSFIFPFQHVRITQDGNQHTRILQEGCNRSQIQHYWLHLPQTQNKAWDVGPYQTISPSSFLPWSQRCLGPGQNLRFMSNKGVLSDSRVRWHYVWEDQAPRADPTLESPRGNRPVRELKVPQ